MVRALGKQQIGLLCLRECHDRYYRWQIESIGAGAGYRGKLPIIVGPRVSSDTERYLGTKQDLIRAPNDAIKLRGMVHLLHRLHEHVSRAGSIFERLNFW